MSKEFQKEEQYIVSESPEINLGEPPGWIEKVKSAFPAFRDRNFRLYFYGQLVSMIGTWLQNVAQGWLVLELTHSAFWVGAAAAVGSAPVLVFGLVGGVIVDRFDRRKILLATQIISMVLALTLGIVAMLHVVTLWEIFLLAFILGSVNAIDLPARSAFIVDLMGDKRFLTSAIALNAATFNASRVVGPAFAGILIAAIGTGGTFILNGLSFIAAIISLAMIRFSATIAEHQAHPFIAMKEGIRYSFSHRLVRIFMAATAVISIFGFSYTSILPSITEVVFRSNAAALGYLYAASGAGALLAAVLISASGRRIRPSLFIAGGSMLLGAVLLIFSFVHILFWGLILSLFIGFSFAVVFSMMNSVIQHMIPDALRGRVMSIYVLMFLGSMPLGGLAFGYGMERWGSQLTVSAGSLLVLLPGIWLMRERRIIDAHSSR